MSDHKLTDEQIIEAIEIRMPEAYDLINRQKLEIEVLNAEIRGYSFALKYDAEHYREDIKNLTTELKIMRCLVRSYKMHYETARSKAIKEFAENVKAIFECDLCFADDVKSYILNEFDSIVKEMTEGNNESQNT